MASRCTPLFGLRYQHTLLAQPFLEQRHQPTYSLVRSSGALGCALPLRALQRPLRPSPVRARPRQRPASPACSGARRSATPVSEEDLLRRLQTGVFSRACHGQRLVHQATRPGSRWIASLNNQRRARAQLGNALEARCREILGWRMQLVPYLRAAFARYALDGTPPFRALCLRLTPPIKPLRISSTTSSSLAIACSWSRPLFAGEPGRDIVFPPAGEWFDLWTRKRSRRQPAAGMHHRPRLRRRRSPPLSAPAPFSHWPAVTNTTGTTLAAATSPSARLRCMVGRTFRIASTAGHRARAQLEQPQPQKGHVEQPARRRAPAVSHVVAWQH